MQLCNAQSTSRMTYFICISVMPRAYNKKQFINRRDSLEIRHSNLANFEEIRIRMFERKAHEWNTKKSIIQNQQCVAQCTPFKH